MAVQKVNKPSKLPFSFSMISSFFENVFKCCIKGRLFKLSTIRVTVQSSLDSLHFLPIFTLGFHIYLRGFQFIIGSDFFENIDRET